VKKRLVIANVVKQSPRGRAFLSMEKKDWKNPSRSPFFEREGRLDWHVLAVLAMTIGRISGQL
jgi:hypothetical protein